jgi:hypothetical protein
MITLPLVFAICLAPIDSAHATADVPAAEAPPDALVPWTSLGGATLRGGGKRTSTLGFANTYGGGLTLDGAAYSLLAHGMSLHVSAAREVDLIAGFRFVHTALYFIPDFEPSLAVHAQLMNRGRYALGLRAGMGVRFGLYFPPLVFSPEAMVTLSALVANRGRSAWTIDTTAGLQASLAVGQRTGVLLPTLGIGFTYHRTIGSFFMQAQYAPIVIAGPTRQATGVGPFGSAWLVIGGQWSGKRG